MLKSVWYLLNLDEDEETEQEVVKEADTQAAKNKV